MKVTGIFLLIALALLTLSGRHTCNCKSYLCDRRPTYCCGNCFPGNTRADSLKREAKCSSEINGCPRIYNPVCGTDGNTYSNECMLCRENEKRQIPVLIQKSGPC